MRCCPAWVRPRKGGKAVIIKSDLCGLVDEVLEFPSFRYRPGGRNRADPAFDQYKLENIIVGDSGKITEGSKEAVFVGKKVRDLKVVRDRVVGRFYCPLLPGGKQGGRRSER